MYKQVKLDKLEEAIGYSFQKKALLTQAMTHSSYSNEKRARHLSSNERLEFLGDAVLELISSEYLFEKHPEMPEGDLTKTRARMVCEPALAFCAKEINLGDYLFLGKGEELTGGRDRDSVTSDGLEALIGAIYLDGGFANAKEFVLSYVMKDTERKQLFFDSKTILQEMVQSNFEGEIAYHLIGEEGPDHNKSFTVEVLMGDCILGKGTGKSKKAAEQQAAFEAIMKLKAKV